MKLEVGKTYITRDGMRVTVTRTSGIIGTQYPFESSVDCYTPDGLVLKGSETERDIVAEAPASAPLRLEVGKTYVTADGTPVKIMGRDEDPSFPFNGSDGDSYASNGTLWGTVSSASDLIAELQEPAAIEAAPAKISLLSAESLDAIMLALIATRSTETPAEIADAFLSLADARAKR